MNTAPLVVFINGERLPLLDDRRFHVAAFFEEGALLADPLFDPPKPIPMSKAENERGITACKLQPWGRYIASPPRTARFGVVLHGLPLATTHKWLARGVSNCLNGAFVEEAIVMQSRSSDSPCNSRGIVFLADPAQAEALVALREIRWDSNTIVVAEPYEVLPVAPPHLFPAVQKIRAAGDEPVAAATAASGAARYYIKLLSASDDESVWAATGSFEDTAEFAARLTASVTRGPVVVVFVKQNNLVGFGTFLRSAQSGNRAELFVDWQGRGVAVSGAEVDLGALTLNLANVKDHDLLRVDLGAEACAAVSRKVAASKASIVSSAPATGRGGRGRGRSRVPEFAH